MLKQFAFLVLLYNYSLNNWSISHAFWGVGGMSSYTLLSLVVQSFSSYPVTDAAAL